MGSLMRPSSQLGAEDGIGRHQGKGAETEDEKEKVRHGAMLLLYDAPVRPKRTWPVGHKVSTGKMRTRYKGAIKPYAMYGKPWRPRRARHLETASPLTSTPCAIVTSRARLLFKAQ
jgi:hypothetical protein